MNEKNMALAEGLVSARYIKQVRLRSRDRSARIISLPMETSALSIRFGGGMISLFQEQLRPKSLCLSTRRQELPTCSKANPPC
jgi:hypothetical protein